MIASPYLFTGRAPEDAPSSRSTSSSPTAQVLADALRNGFCPEDHQFDRFLPEGLRALSGRRGTPLSVTQCATRWLDEYNVRTVLDVGSGAGKFCVAAALAGHCHFTGLEQRRELVEAARTLARVFDVGDRACFLEGALGELPLPRVDAYCLYDAFDPATVLSEAVLSEAVPSEAAPSQVRPQANVERSGRRGSGDGAAVQKLLWEASVGTYILTYADSGLNLPPGYRELRVHHGMAQVLRLFRKVSTLARRSISGSSPAATASAA